MIISVHMPKSGGASFKHLLESHFGNKFLSDHDYPIHESPACRQKKIRRKQAWSKISDLFLFRYCSVECIHGHFLAYKYNHFYETGDHTFVTWFRDPVERLESHYFYWKHHYKKMKARPLLKKFIEEEWTFEEFAFSNEIRNIYSMFLWNFPVERFGFIGITEFFDEDLQYFAKNYLELTDVTVPEKNQNKKKRGKKITDKGLIREIREYHSEDYKLYNYALNLRSKR